MTNTIVIDAGHGGHDPGTSFNGVLEKDAALATAITAKYLLAQAGYDVHLTRIKDEYPSFQERTQHIPGSLCYISFHYNMPESYGLVYYEDEDYGSLDLAEHLAREAGLSRIWASSRSNHGGLYIDRVDPPAVIYEVAAIDDYPTEGGQSREFRLRAGWAVTRAVLRWHWDRMKQ